MHIVFIVWNIFGGILIYFYLAGFLEILLSKQSEEPVDTAQQILDRGLVPFVWIVEDWYLTMLEDSPIPALQEIARKTIVPDTLNHYLELCKEGILEARTHVLFGTMIDGDEEYYYGEYYWSRDPVPGSIPYGAAIMNKKWPYAEQYNHHLMIITEVSIQSLYQYCDDNALGWIDVSITTF